MSNSLAADQHPRTRRRLIGDALLSSGAVLAACGGEAPGGDAGRAAAHLRTPAPARLVWANQGGDPAWQAVRDGTIDAFTRKYPHVTVERIFQASTVGYLDKVQVMIRSGTQLDLFMTTPIDVPGVAVKGLYIPLDTLMARDRFPVQNWSPTALSAYAFRGKQYGFPEEINFDMVVYNRDRLDLVGEKPPAGNWSREQFLDLARKLTVRSGAETTRWGVGAVDVGGLNAMLPWFWGDGGAIFDNEQDPRKSTLASAPNVDAWQWRADWAHRLGVAATPAQLPRTGAQAAFVNGGLGLHVIGLISLVTLAGAIKSFAWDVVPVPRGRVGQFNFAGAQGQGLALNSRQQDQAWLALQHQVSHEGLLPYVMAQFGLPPQLSLRQDYLQLPAPPANRAGLIESLASLRPLPKAPLMPVMSAIYTAELDNVFQGRRTAREAAEDVDRQVQAQLETR